MPPNPASLEVAPQLIIFLWQSHALRPAAPSVSKRKIQKVFSPMVRSVAVSKTAIVIDHHQLMHPSQYFSFISSLYAVDNLWHKTQVIMIRTKTTISISFPLHCAPYQSLCRINVFTIFLRRVLCGIPFFSHPIGILQSTHYGIFGFFR